MTCLTNQITKTQITTKISSKYSPGERSLDTLTSISVTAYEIVLHSTSASDIMQAEKSWMSRLGNPKLATTYEVFFLERSHVMSGTPPR